MNKKPVAWMLAYSSHNSNDWRLLHFFQGESFLYWIFSTFCFKYWVFFKLHLDFWLHNKASFHKPPALPDCRTKSNFFAHHLVPKPHPFVHTKNRLCQYCLPTPQWQQALYSNFIIGMVLLSRHYKRLWLNLHLRVSYASMHAVAICYN